MKKLSVFLALTAGVVLINACRKDITENSSLSGNVTLNLPDTLTEYYKNDADEINHRATLGRVLFYDGHLSVNNAVSCASCHKQELAFADDVAFSRGFEGKLTGRNSPAIQNILGVNLKITNRLSMMQTPLFWDGRETNLMAFAGRPINNHVEMGMDDPEALTAKLTKLPYYADLFNKAYGDEQITFERVTESIAIFMGAIQSQKTRFDRYQRGDGQLTALELQGLNLFHTKYNCGECHNVTQGYHGTENFMNIGLDENPKDRGRAAISRMPQDEGGFRTPNLRNVALTAPYMHDGRFKTLEHVLEHYSKDIKDVPNLAEPLRDAKHRPLKMNISDHEKTAIVAFLNTLTDYDMITDAKYSSPFKVN